MPTSRPFSRAPVPAWLLPALLCVATTAASPIPAVPAIADDPGGSTDPHVPLPAHYFDPPPLSYNNGLHTPDPGHGWADPSQWGGSMLVLVENGMREPINVIVSGASDPYVLSDGGFRDYARSIGYSFECFNLHIGAPMRADVGDGNGMVEERFEYRQVSNWDAGRLVGSCRESITGGNHFRVWKQYGPLEQTGAWFLAVSSELNLFHKHKIRPDGYNQGRDLLVNASLSGGSFRRWEWSAEVQYTDRLLKPGNEEINHGHKQDGRVAILTIERIRTGDPPVLEQVGSYFVRVLQFMAQFAFAVLTELRMRMFIL